MRNPLPPLELFPKKLLDELVTAASAGLTDLDPLLWRCTVCTGSWSNSYRRRAEDGKGCPYCAGQRVLPGFNDLLSRYPRVSAEYSSLNKLPPNAITAKSGRRVIWDCSKCKQSYEAIVGNRTSLGRGCPYCAGKRPIKGVNDLATLRPDLLAEWSPSNAKGPSEYTLYSNHTVEWICAFGHTWMARPATRASGKNCKACSRKESHAEKELLEFIENVYAGETLANHRKLLGGLELDVYLPEVRLAVEYNGLYWHGDEFLARRGVTAEQLHSEKFQRCSELGVKLLYVWEDDWKLRKSAVKAALLRVLAGEEPDGLLMVLSKD